MATRATQALSASRPSYARWPNTSHLLCPRAPIKRLCPTADRSYFANLLLRRSLRRPLHLYANLSARPAAACSDNSVRPQLHSAPSRPPFRRLRTDCEWGATAARLSCSESRSELADRSTPINRAGLSACHETLGARAAVKRQAGRGDGLAALGDGAIKRTSS